MDRVDPPQQTAGFQRAVSTTATTPPGLLDARPHTRPLLRQCVRCARSLGGAGIDVCGSVDNRTFSGVERSIIILTVFSPTLKTFRGGVVTCLFVATLMLGVGAAVMFQGSSATAEPIPGSTDSANLAPSASGAAGVSAAPAFPTPIRHVVIVMLENKNYSYVMQRGRFEAYLANTYATATNAYSLQHWSVPSYQAATSAADTYTIPLDRSNIGDLADSAGLSWATFEQSMPTLCNKTLDWTAGYMPAHNPFIMYDDIVENAARCEAHDLTYSSWTNDVALGEIPNFAFIAPNVTNDGHNGTQADGVANADQWLHDFFTPLVNDSSIFSDTAFIVAYDEAFLDYSPLVNGTTGGQIYTVVVSPYSTGLSSDHFYTTFSLLTTAEWLLGLPGGTLGTNDSWAVSPPMTDLFSFSPTTYSVQFAESGLPPGTAWWVNLSDGRSSGSTTDTVTILLSNGSYSFVPRTANTSFSAPASTFVVDGEPVSEVSRFALVTYPLTFTESGLPTDTVWWVNVSGQAPRSSLASTITMSLPNGSYGFAVAASAGYIANATSGRSTVHGSPQTIMISFASSASPSSGGGSSTNGSNATDQVLLGVLVASAVGVGMAFLIRGRRRRRPKPPPTQGTKEPSPSREPGS